MQWLSDIFTYLLANILNLDISNKIVNSIHFLLYDSIKVFILLSILVFFVSYIQSYFPQERTKNILTKFKRVSASILSALLGTVTPFCSCSSIPIFIGFTKARMPLNVTLSFLISSPLVDIVSLFLIASFFGMKIAITYMILGLIIAVFAGNLKLREQIRDLTNKNNKLYNDSTNFNKKQRLSYAKIDTLAIIKSLYKYILVGVFIGAIIHNWIPKNILLSILGESNPFSVIIATLVGIPIYADIFGTIPIAKALFQSGVSVGTILSFIMNVTAPSLSSMIMLSKILKPKLLIAFISIVTLSIIITGYLFNLFGYLL